jgi:hypothetical protein
MAFDQTPTRQTSAQQLASWNQAWRTSPLYAQIMRNLGVDTSGPIHLDEGTAHAVERALRENGVQLPDGMKIDNAGNLNQTNTLWRNVGIGAGLTGAALTGLGAAGVGPLSGLFGAGAAAGAGAGTAGAGEGGWLASSSLPAALTMNAAPAALTAGGNLAGLGAIGGADAVLASSQIPEALGTYSATPATTAGQSAAATAGSSAAKTAAAAAGGGSTIDKIIQSLTKPSTAIPLAAGVASLFGDNALAGI